MEVLYVYDHCPFCVKARMIFGLKKRPFELKYLLNDDEQTPIRMIGQKMLPILQEGQHYMGESMDIVHKIDQLDNKPILTGNVSEDISVWLKQTGYVNKLVISRYVNAGLPEFATLEAKAYFTAKKEPVFGDFATLLAETPQWLEKINQHLKELDTLLVKSFKKESEEAYGCHGELSEDDIHLFPTLRGLSIVEGINYPALVDDYRQRMANKSGVPLYKIS